MSTNVVSFTLRLNSTFLAFSVIQKLANTIPANHSRMGDEIYYSKAFMVFPLKETTYFVLSQNVFGFRARFLGRTRGSRFGLSVDQSLQSE